MSDIIALFCFCLLYNYNNQKKNMTTQKVSYFFDYFFLNFTRMTK